MHILAIFTSILRKCLFKSSAHFLNWVVFVPCLLFFIQSGCYSHNRCRSLILWLLFHFLEHVLCRTVYFISDEVQFIFILFTFVLGVISKHILPNTRSQRFLPILSSKSFIVLVIIFRSSHFELILLFGVR